MRSFCLSLLCSFLLGCGYQVGSLLPPETTIAVPIFQNETLYRGYEIFLTNAVVSEILTTTPLKVISKNQAGTWLQGSIRKIEQSTVVKDKDRRATELDVTIHVEITWYNQDGSVKLPSRTIVETTQIAAKGGDNLDAVITDALRYMGRKIVAQLEHPYWPKEDTP